MNERQSQEKRILDYLKKGKRINPLTALRLFSCFRLGARCWELRQQGIPIKSEIVKRGGKHYSEYWLEA